MLEKDIDARIVKYAKDKGLIAIKLSMLGMFGFAGLPDRMFLGPGRIIFFIEMKAPGQTRTPLQLEWGKRLEEFGFNVYECDDIGYGKAIIDHEIRPA